MATVFFRGTRADITRIALQMAAVLAGRAPDTQGVARGFMLTLGFAALSDIKQAFLVKAAGGTDEMGIRWPPLSPETIANRRVGKKDREASALIQIRERIRKRETKKVLKRFRLSLPEGEAQRRAKIVGGLKATRETGRTKVETLGGRSVEILRDTGVLLNSLSPGTLDASGKIYSKPTATGKSRRAKAIREGGAQQIFEPGAGQIIVGTNVKYAATHQHGDAKRNIPARPFLPDENNPVPPIWFDRWVVLANKALVVGAELLYRRGV